MIGFVQDFKYYFEFLSIIVNIDVYFSGTLSMSKFLIRAHQPKKTPDCHYYNFYKKTCNIYKVDVIV